MHSNISGELLIRDPKGPWLGWVKVAVNSCKIVTKSANSLPISLERQVWASKGVSRLMKGTGK